MMRLSAASAPVLVIALIAGTYALAREPQPSSDRIAALASAYRFERFALPSVAPSERTHPPHTVREVNRALTRIRAWVSAVGAAVTIGDLRDQGVARDLCYVDPRTDSLVVAPVPGTAPVYRPFALRPPHHAGTDPSTVAPMGCVIADLDEDGVPDVLAYYWGRSPVIFHARRRAARLDAAAFEPRELVAGVPRWYTNAVVATNLSGAGHADLVIGNYFRDGARILDPHASDSCAMQRSMSRGLNGGGLHLLRWTRTGYREEPGAFGPEVAGGWTLALAAAPLAADGLPAIYVADDFGPDHLLRNTGAHGALRFRALYGVRRLDTPRSSVLGTDSFKGMGAEFADLLGRGRFDIFVSNITDPYALEESNFAFLNDGDENAPERGTAPFTNRAEALGLARGGWAWDAKVADFDNSGRPAVLQATGFVRGDVNRWPELQELATGNDELLCDARDWPRIAPGDDLSGHESLRFFVTPRRGERYADVADALALTSDAVGRGIAIADTSARGLLDFAVANQWGESAFFRNVSPHPGAALEVRVRFAIDPLRAPLVDAVPVGLRSRAALGSTVEIRSAAGTMLAVVDASNGHSGHRDPTVHAGLGVRAGPVGAVVRWRTASGAHRLFVTFAPGRHVVVLPSS